MATLTDTIKSDLQLDLGIGTDESVFTDDQLSRLYTRASGDYDATMVLALRRLTQNATKLHDYAVATASESVSQVYDHLKERLEYYESRVSRATKQVKMVGLRSVPPRWKDEPR